MTDPLMPPAPPEAAAAPPAPTPAPAPAAAPAATISLVGRDGQLHQVAPEHAAAAVASGDYGWVHGSRVAVVDPASGQIRHVASEHASDYLAAAPNAKLATPAEEAAAAEEKQYGGIGHTLAAAGEGAARGLTAGLSDPLAVGIGGLFGAQSGEAVRQHLQKTQEHHNIAATGGELVGAIAPMLVGDEAGIASIVGSVPRGIDAAGEMAAGVASRLVGTGAEGLLGRGAQKAIKGAAQAIVEGGLWGAGQEVSAATLENRDLTAENLLAAAGHSALLAGAVGGIAGAASPLAEKAWGKMAGHADEALEKLADEQYVRALSSNKKSLIQDIKDRWGKTEGVGVIADRLRTEGIVAASDDIEAIAGKAAKAQESAIDGLGEAVNRVGASGVRLEDVMQNLETRAAEFDRQLGMRAAARAVREQIQDLGDVYRPLLEKHAESGAALKDFEVPLKDLLSQRRGLESTIDWKTDSVLAAGKRAAGRTIEDSIMNAGEAAAKAAGEPAGWAAEYQAAKDRFSQLRFINDVLEDSASAKLRNRSLSPSDMLAAHLGGTAGAATHGLLGGGLSGIVLGAAHKAVRERGNATAAVLLDKLGSLGGLSEVHGEAMSRLDSAIHMGLNSESARATKTAIPARRAFTEGRFEKEAERVSQLAAAGPAQDAHLSRGVAPLAGHSPEIAAAVKQKTTAATAYLASKLPPAYGAPTANSLTPQIKAPVPKAQQAAFLRAVDAVEDGPEDIVRDALKGHASLDEIDALKHVYPAYYAEAQKRVVAACSSRKEPLPYQKAVRLGILFDTATAPSLTPEAIQQEQGIYAKSPAAAPSPPPGKASGRPRGNTTKPLKSVSMMGGMFEPGSQSQDSGGQ